VAAAEARAERDVAAGAEARAVAALAEAAEARDRFRRLSEQLSLLDASLGARDAAERAQAQEVRRGAGGRGRGRRGEARPHAAGVSCAWLKRRAPSHGCTRGATFAQLCRH